ncbi:MAG: tetratricopeptide repeat protein [Cyanobacteria bacterium CRU_2_1]|nr:tetratricopeptide repeat protein [Cyanobacteria bacterium RU_5_0]NJR62417.1 tetratricopeptide repeat protein [Cyanobacteria bacterium CRU_2_1]
MNRLFTNFNQTLTPGSTDSAVWYNCGESLANLAQYDEALACFEWAISLQPDNFAAWVFRGVMLIQLEQFDEALKSCDRAIEICPTHSEAWVFRGVTLHRMGRYQDAYVSYGQATGDRYQSFWLRLNEMVRWAWNAIRQKGRFGQYLTAIFR